MKGVTRLPILRVRTQTNARSQKFLLIHPRYTMRKGEYTFAQRRSGVKNIRSRTPAKGQGRDGRNYGRGQFHATVVE